MAGGYNIAQVDVPGILGLYQQTQDRRVQQMLLQRKIAAEDRDLARAEQRSKIYSNITLPGLAGAQPKGGDPSSGGMSGAYAAPSTPVAPSAPLAAQPGAVAPIGAVAPASGAPAALPANVTPEEHGILASNSENIRQMMQIDPKGAMELYGTLKGMDDAARARVVDAQDALEHLAVAVQSLPYEQRRAVIQQRAGDLVRAHPGLTPEMVQQFDPTDQNLMVIVNQALGVKGMAEQAEKARAFEETQRNHRATEAVAQGNLAVRQGALGLARGREARVASGKGKGGGASGDVGGLSTADLIRMAGGGN